MMIGRLLGALRSFNRAAYLALLIKLIKPVTRVLDKILAPRQKSIENQGLPYKIVFIVGPPRSGSTITYQFLAETLRCAYISNWHALLPGMGSGLLPSIDARRSALNNYYGYTPWMSDVYEGNEFFAAVEKLKEPELIRAYLIELFEKINPRRDLLIIKNVGVYPNLSGIAESLPEAHFLVVQRDPIKNALSELYGYHELKTFNPIPDAMSDRDMHEDPPKFAFDQISYINQRIQHELEAVDKSRVYNFHFEAFINAPEEQLLKLLQHFNIPSSLIGKKNLNTLLPKPKKKIYSPEIIARMQMLAKEASVDPKV